MESKENKDLREFGYSAPKIEKINNPDYNPLNDKIMIKGYFDLTIWPLLKKKIEMLPNYKSVEKIFYDMYLEAFSQGLYHHLAYLRYVEGD